MDNSLRGIVKAVILSSLFILGTTVNTKIGAVLPINTVETPVLDTAKTRLVKSFFGRYNKELKQSTVRNFMEVSHSYGFTSDDDLFLDCIHQICLESQAKQSARNKSGAMGICQVTPTTAFEFIHKCDQEALMKMASLGASNMDWAIHGKYSYTNDSLRRPFLGKTLRKQAIDWLSVERNNLIVWGAIMSDGLAVLDKDQAFLRFHLGKQGQKRYQGHPSKHEYIRLIARISSKRKGGS